MSETTPTLQSDTPASVNQKMVIGDDGDTIRITSHGRTYVFKDETARIVRAHRAQYADGPEVAAFWDGYLTCLAMAFSQLKEKQNGKKAERQDEPR